MPYAPQTQYRGDAYQFEGGQRTAAAIGGWLENFLNQQKQINDAGKSADYFVKANPDALQEMGIHPDEFTNLGAREKAAAVSGYVKSKSVQQAAAEAQARIAQQQAEARKSQMDVDAASGFPDFARFLQESLGNVPPSGAPPAAVTDGTGTSPYDGPPQGAPGGRAPSLPMNQAILAALGRVQALNPRTAAAIASKVLPSLIGQEDLTTGSYKDPTTGAVFVQRGKQILPAGFDPKMSTAASEPQAAHDEDGNLIGYTQTDVRGHSTFRPFKGGNKLPAAEDGDGKPIPGFYITPEGKIVDARTGIKKLTGVDAPTPTDEAYLKKNPALREKYDAKFGAGSAAKVLGK